ncbi:TPA: PRD domain-containing protein [Streptococcus suis]|nr:PRD domain-containing protein [Streptococcus suis]HEP1835485.1 PRD domain-containing protein [Streptococcus suis]
MKIVKVLNNSTVIAQDGEMELVVMGKGISFGKRPGDWITPSKIEKIFWLDSGKNAVKLAKLLAEIPILYFEVVRDLIDIAEAELDISLNETIYLSLTEHIQFAVQRYQEGAFTPNAMLLEIATVYQVEYQFALRCLSYLEQQLDVRLPNDEAGFIALHLILAQGNSRSRDKVTELTTTVYDLVRIVQEYYQLTFLETDPGYSRFVVHLKFFIMRLLQGEQLPAEDIALYQALTTTYNRAKGVLPVITSYLERKYDYRLCDGEAFYLTLHIHRLLNR